MSVYLIICAYVSLAGVAYLAMMFWTRANKEKLLSKYKPGSIAYEATIKNLQAVRIPVTFVVTLLSAFGTILLTQNLLEKHADVAKTVITTSAWIVTFLFLSSIYAVYSVFSEKKK